MFAEFDELAIAVELLPCGSSDTQFLELIGAGSTSMLRLPKYEMCHSTKFPVVDRLSIALSPGPQVDLVAVTLTCSLTKRSYITHASQLRWDFVTLLRAIVISYQLADGAIPLHAATLAFGGQTHLLLGESGAGKSVTCAAAIDYGITVLSSELAFVGGGRFRAGNHIVEVSHAAREAFKLRHISPLSACGYPGADTWELDIGPHSAPITRISIVRVDFGSLRVSPIKPLRARTVLFENSMRQHPVSSLIAEQGIPLVDGIPPTDLATIARESALLSTLPAQTIAGPPRAILQQLLTSSRA